MKKMVLGVVMLAAACGLCGCGAQQQTAQMVPVDVKLATVIHHDDGNQQTINYVYDERGNLLSDKSEGDVRSGWWENAYDKDNKLRLATMYGVKGKPEQRIVYAYDEDGMNTGIEAFMKYDTGWAWDSSTWMEYDAAGNMIVIDIDDHYDDYHYRYEYVYDSDGRLLRSWCADATGEILTIDEYDYEDGRDVDGQTLAGDDESDGYLYTYDEQGRVLTVSGVDENGAWRTWYENIYGQIEVREDSVDNALAQQVDL